MHCTSLKPAETCRRRLVRKTSTIFASWQTLSHQTQKLPHYVPALGLHKYASCPHVLLPFAKPGHLRVSQIVPCIAPAGGRGEGQQGGGGGGGGGEKGALLPGPAP